MYSCNKTKSYFFDELIDLQLKYSQDFNFEEYLEATEFFSYVEKIAKKVNKKYLIQIDDASDKSITIIINRVNFL